VKGRGSVAAARRSRGSFAWYAVAGVIVLVGVVLVAMSTGGGADEPPKVGDHWHAAIGVNVCGTWQPDAPEFHERVGTVLQAGIHSHGDGLIHLHPYSSDEAGARATVGRFFGYGGWSVSSSSLQFWNGSYDSDSRCGDEPAHLRWSVNGDERTGDDPGDYRPEQGDVIAIAILPDDQEIGEPPSAAALASPSDLAPSVSVEPPGSTTSAPGSTPTSAAPTDTTAAGDAGAGTTLPGSATTVPSGTTSP
jgi:hypothetical protein